MLPQLTRLWTATNVAAAALDAEVNSTLITALEGAIAALEQLSFGARINQAATALAGSPNSHQSN